MRFAFAPESRPLDGYTIKRAIHRGGFGEVYYALSDAGKEVALKLLHNNMEVELRGVTQCLNLKHPNLVTIFDIRQDSENEHWIVMEYVGGQSLYDVLGKYPAGMPQKEILAWLDGMTAGLSFLHDRGLVHRDLKPANIFSDAGVVKIGDVGLSKFISESHRSAQTQSVGTVYYMAPEVARGRYGKEVDVYSMGIMLCEMLCGRVPFDGETTAEILMKHLTADPDLSGLSQSMQKVLAAALEKDPNRRVQSVEELRRQFLQALSCPEPADKSLGDTIAVRNPGSNSNSGIPTAEFDSSSTKRFDQQPSLQAKFLDPVIQFWNERIPTPAKWVITGAFLIVLLNYGILRNSRLLLVGGVLGWIAWWFFRSEKVSGNPATSAGESAQPTASAAVRTGTTMSSEPTRSGPARGIPMNVKAAGAGRPQLLRNSSPCTRRSIPLDQRLINLTSSMSVSMLSVLVVSVALYFATPLLPSDSDALFFTVATLFAAWAVMIPSRLMEGTGIDPWFRRMILGLSGAFSGLLMGKMAEFLMLSSSSMLTSAGRGLLALGPAERLRVLSTEDGGPTLAGFIVFPAVLLFVRRWWWQADSFRGQRFRILSAIMTMLVSVLLSRVMAFPTAFAATFALAVSVVVQLSSGWTPHGQRFLGKSDPEARGHDATRPVSRDGKN
ncbi:MAG: serine/threonine-protein kinase [Planctomycetia bacterium]